MSKGFTLIEMMLSVGILSLLAGLSLPVYQSFQNRNELDITTQSLASALRRAQTYSRGMNGDSQWGVAVQANTITLFKGSSYAARDTAYDESTAIATSTSTSGSTEIMFTKLTGLPATTGSFTLTSINNDSRTVTINAKGMVSY